MFAICVISYLLILAFGYWIGHTRNGDMVEIERPIRFRRLDRCPLERLNIPCICYTIDRPNIVMELTGIQCDDRRRITRANVYYVDFLGKHYGDVPANEVYVQC